MKNKILLLLPMVLLISCSAGNEREKVEEEPSFYFEEIASFGEEQLPNDLLLGSIQDITVDADGNVYVLDNGLKHVVKFGPDGSFQRTLANGEGRGPGEFLAPTMLSVDGNGQVYVYDRNMQKVVRINAENEFISEFNIENMPSRMAVNEAGYIFITNYGVPFPIKGPKVFKYAENEAGTYELVDRFVNLSKEIDTRNRGLAGNTDKMAIGSDSLLYFAVWYPYEIRTYTISGDSLKTLKRDVPFFTEPSIDASTGMVRSDGRIDEVLPFQDRLIAVRLSDMSNSDTTISYIDFWNKEGELLGTFTESKIGLQPNARQFITDGENILYVSYNEPTPHITKYRLEAN